MINFGRLFLSDRFSDCIPGMQVPVKSKFCHTMKLINIGNKASNSFMSRGCCESPDPEKESEQAPCRGCAKLDTTDWMKDFALPSMQKTFDCIEMRFKNSRKDFYRLPAELKVQKGDILAVEALPGHDLGVVSLTGETCRMQMKKKHVNPQSDEIRRVYRKARGTDIEKWIMAVDREEPTMYRCRTIARSLGLEMKINDVEFQGDNTKAIFYYTAEDRVDFRQLIKLLAEEFRVRIEMRQIGVRQEASRLGGIGSCGRELCCSTWLTDFRSVTTSSARVQQLTLNPQKLAGQCGKLKCCLNYEYEAYNDSLRHFPRTDVVLKTREGDAIFQKSDVFKKLMWFSYEKDPGNMMALPIDKVKRIMRQNEKGEKPNKLEDFAFTQETKVGFESGEGQDDLTRFDD